MADEVSLPTVTAMGVVTSLEDADITSGAAMGGNAGAVEATGVFCIDSCRATVASAEVVIGLGVDGSECFSREKRGE